MSAVLLERPQATIDDLYKVEGKAEIVNGEIVTFMPTGGKAGFAGDWISASLLMHWVKLRKGRAVGDNKAFLVNLPSRRSFSPDAAYYFGPDPDEDFFTGPPAFAVEVRSKGDYGPAAEREIEAKRHDYFKAGTEIVWDVDLRSADVIRAYHVDLPDSPRIFRRGEIADAEPVVPGWNMLVDELFDVQS